MSKVPDFEENVECVVYLYFFDSPLPKCSRYSHCVRRTKYFDVFQHIVVGDLVRPSSYREQPVR